MLGNTTPPVFFVPALPEGDHGALDGDEARHAVTVRRLRVGERLTVSDGAGAVAECQVTEVSESGRGRESRLSFAIERRAFEPAPSLRVTVVQALAKGDRGELAVELATEAGVDAILPWQAARSVARWDGVHVGSRGAKALARWRNTARTAAKQARRAWIPPVLEPVNSGELPEALQAMAAVLVFDAQATRRLAELELPTTGELAMVVGPEGGIAPDELTLLLAAGAEPVRLGPTVLRTSTAAAVALGGLGVLTERWN